MAGNCQVKICECVGSIACAFGMPWEEIWNHPTNAEIKQKRENPSLLKAGSILFSHAANRLCIFWRPANVTRSPQKATGQLALESIGPVQLPVFALRLFEPRLLVVIPVRFPVSRSIHRTHCLGVSARQPNLAATAMIAVHCDGYDAC